MLRPAQSSAFNMCDVASDSVKQARSWCARLSQRPERALVTKADALKDDLLRKEGGGALAALVEHTQMSTVRQQTYRRVTM